MLDPVENDLSDYGGIDEDETFAPLPPPHSPSRGGQEEGDPLANGEEDGDESKLAEVPAAKRRGVKRPQPKLDSQRLISERGLPALRTMFDKVHFKGKGHEVSDLRLLMQKMENWAHRLYPKLQFEDFIEKVERLGNKKEVQTCLKRIRLDMPLTDEDFIGGEEATAEQQVFGDPDPFSEVNFPDDRQAPIHSTPAAPPAPSLTEEQRRRMELNRQRALERKLARQQQQQTDPSDSQTVDEPTSISSGNILDRSDAQGKTLDLDPNPVHSSTQQPGQLSNRDSEPAAESRQPVKEAKTSLDSNQQPSNSEDGD